MRRHGWARHLLKDFEHNPRTQFRFHRWAMYFWVLNFVAGSVIMFVFPHFWVQIGVYYVFALSIYANADTDADALSASQASMRGEEILAAFGAGQVAHSRPEPVAVVVEESEGHVAPDTQKTPEATPT